MTKEASNSMKTRSNIFNTPSPVNIEDSKSFEVQLRKCAIKLQKLVQSFRKSTALNFIPMKIRVFISSQYDVDES